MVISHTPYRMSFFGGGTDYPQWYLQHGGLVLATTINKYLRLSCRYLPPFFDYRFRIVYSQIETVKEIKSIQHPAVRAVLEYLQWDRGIEVHYDGDLPARAGLGSSSAFTVGLIHTLMALQGKYISKQDLASSAIHVEQQCLKENVGSQDQICAAYGGINVIRFSQNGNFRVQPLIVRPERLKDLQSHLLLFFTGIVRTASDVARSQLENIPIKTRELSQMQALAEEAVSQLQSSAPMDQFGRLLHESWMHKKSLSNLISDERIDGLYEAARRAGAIGGKLLGAGGGGFLLLFVRPEDQPAVRNALTGLLHVPFEFEDIGSRIVVYQPEKREASMVA